MPRVAGVNLLAWLAGAVAIYFVGFLMYGVVFGHVWTQQTLLDHGLVTADKAASLTDDQIAVMKIPGAMDMTLSMSLGFVISLVTALGLCIAQRIMKPQSMGEALRNGLVLWFGFAATTLSYNVVYSSNSTTVLGIDLMHLFLDYLIASAVIFLIDGKALSGTAHAMGSGKTGS